MQTDCARSQKAGPCCCTCPMALGMMPLLSGLPNIVYVLPLPVCP